MAQRDRLSRVGVVGVVLLFCTAAVVSLPAAAAEIRSQAAVSLSFEEETGGVKAAVRGVEGDFAGEVINGGDRVASPFWNQEGKRALLLDAAKKQYVRLADVPYLDRAEAVSLSFFFLNLHEPADAAMHGIVAKRSGSGGRTNYGINYAPKRDVFQLYVNDGSGFRVAVYSVKAVIGARRRAHLTATFEVADARDVRVRLFVNGRPAKPASVNTGRIDGNDAWLTGVNTAALLNDVPLTLGASFPDGEPVSGLIDEFLLFTRALEADEANALFLEVAGANGAELAKREQLERLAPPEPEVRAVSLQGLEIGATTRLTIRGKNLSGEPRVHLPGSAVQQRIVEGSNAGRLIVDLSLPAGTKPGYYPLRVQTAEGISNALPLAMDGLREFAASETSAEKPAELPGAYSGTLVGAQRSRVYFRGKAGERIVADLEARRLGSRLEPVLEIKSAEGTPLLIEWGEVALRGDPRCVMRLPEEGLYYAEVHDLAFEAPGGSRFRLKLGDLALVDAWFPPAVAAGDSTAVEPVGVGLPGGAQVAADLFDAGSGLAVRLPLPEALHAAGPAPAIQISGGAEVVEEATAKDKLQSVDASFAANRTPVYINGRVLEPGEEDRYLLKVTGGQKLNFSLQGRAIHSPLDGELAILAHPGGNVLATSQDRPGSRDPLLDFTVPGDVTQIEAAVRDLHGRGGPHFLYRLCVSPAERPDFRLAIQAPEVVVPEEGRAVVKARLEREGYNGPVRLSIAGDPWVKISPAELPAGGGSREVLLTLSRETGGGGRLMNLKIIAETVDLQPAVRRIATVGAGMPIDGFEDLLPLAMGPGAGISVDVSDVPPALFKGVTAEATVSLQGDTQAVRLGLVSTEKPRPIDPNNRGQGNKPLVRAAANQVLAAGEPKAKLRIAVPLDVAEAALDVVVRAEVIPHPYSNQVIASAYSEPIRLPVQTAATVSLDKGTFNLAPGRENKVKGTIKRAAGFEKAVVVALTGLPEGFSAPRITIPADNSEFELAVNVPDDTKPQALAKVALRVSVAGGGAILPDQAVALKVVPGMRDEG